jgi:hypothetical protein
MTKCTFYRTEATTLRTNVSRADRREGPPKRMVVGWCGHVASPVTREAALSGSKLTCGGDLAKCPIADKLG